MISKAQGLDMKYFNRITKRFNFIRAEDSICHSHLIKSGDFLIISSDGMFDNLYEDEIALIIDQSINSSCSADSSLKITSELLSSICNVIVQKASKG